MFLGQQEKRTILDDCNYLPCSYVCDNDSLTNPSVHVRPFIAAMVSTTACIQTSCEGFCTCWTLHSCHGIHHCLHSVMWRVKTQMVLQVYL